MLKIHRFLFAAVLGLIAALPAASHAQELQWKFSEGDTFDLVIEQSSAVTTTVDRRSIEQDNRMTLDIRWVVEAVDGDGVAKIRQTITRVQVEMTMPLEGGQEKITYDSSVEKHRGPAKRVAKSFSKIVNQPVLVSITPRGEIRGVEVPDETMELLRQMPGSMQGRKMFEIENLQTMFRHAGTMLPAEQPAEGTTWQVEREFAVNTPQVFNQTDRYVLGPLVQGVREITFTSTLEPAGRPAKAPAGEGDTIEFEELEMAEQDSSGTLWFDVENGHCQKSDSQMMFQTKSRYRDMEVNVSITSRSRTTVQRNPGE